MNSLALQIEQGRPLSILCIGAHPDDIEIGCGGTILRLLDGFPEVHVRWIVFSGDPRRKAEAEEGAWRFLEKAVERTVDVLSFRDAHFPASESAIKEFLAEVGASSAAHLVLTHHLHDRHQDHRTLAHATWQTFRNHLILEYEIPKYEGDLGHPNCYVPLDPETRGLKIAHILESFPSQQGKRWFDASTFEGLMRIRGVECGTPEGYAEAFHVRKFPLSTGSTLRPSGA